MAGSKSPMVFQEALNSSEDSTSQFFELANSEIVRYRTTTGALIDIVQDRTAQTHTGGIVWETAFLLASYFEKVVLSTENKPSEEKKRNKEPKINDKTVLEVGAGCGLLGLVLAHCGYKVLLTEHPNAIANLRQNVKRNTEQRPPLEGKDISAAVKSLRWGADEDIQEIQSMGDTCSPFDIIVGTDVVYQVEYVEPLLRTMHSLSHDESVVWLCIQERCIIAYEKLLELAPLYFSTVEEIIMEDLPKGFEYAHELECKLFRFAHRTPRV